MKNLKIEYNGLLLFDAEVDEFQWNDGPQGVSVAGKLKKAAASAASPVGGFLERIVGASKAQTQQVIEEKRATLITDVEEAPVVE